MSPRKHQTAPSFAEHLYYFSLSHSRSWKFCGKFMVHRLAFFIHGCNSISKAIAASVRPFYTLLKPLVEFLPQTVYGNILDSLVKVAFNGVVVLLPHITIVVGELGSPFHIRHHQFRKGLSWRKRSIPTHSEWLYPLTFDAGKGLKEA